MVERCAVVEGRCSPANQLRNPHVMQGCSRIKPLGMERKGEEGNRKRDRWGNDGKQRGTAKKWWRDGHSAAAVASVRR